MSWRKLDCILHFSVKTRFAVCRPISHTKKISALRFTLMMVMRNSIAVFVSVLTLATVIAEEEEEAVRLVDGPSPNCGRLEMFSAGEWGLVCSKDWDEENTHMVCTQLGFVHGLASGLQWSGNDTSIGSADGSILRLGEVECLSSASSLSDCSHRGWGNHNCSLEGDIVHMCCDPRPPFLPVRLTCPPCTELTTCRTCPIQIHPAMSDCRAQPAVAGIVEVMVNGVWGPISAEGWDLNDATVVCGQLGYPTTYPQGSPPPSIDEVWPQYRQLLETSFLPGSGAPESQSLLLDECSETHLNELELLIQKFSSSLLQGVLCLGTESELLSCSMRGVGSKPNPSRGVAAVRCGFKPHFNCLSEARKVQVYHKSYHRSMLSNGKHLLSYYISECQIEGRCCRVERKSGG